MYLCFLWNKPYVDDITIAMVDEVLGFFLTGLARFIGQFYLSRFLLFSFLLVF